MQNRFTPILESLGDRVNPSTVTDLDVVVYAGRDVSETSTTLEGQECLVFYLGGIKTSDPDSFTQDGRSSGL